MLQDCLGSGYSDRYFLWGWSSRKIYEKDAFWIKMLALLAGTCFTLYIKQPLLSRPRNEINPLTIKMIAIASLLVWTTVAATGRWIGFT